MCFVPPFVAYANCPDKFTLKFHHGDEFTVDPKTYIGGSVRYVDMCDVDVLSYLEICNMLNDLGEHGLVSVSYKVPNSISKLIYAL